MRLKNYLAVVALLCAPRAVAQYNPTIDVEGTYKPEVILQERINAFPERTRLGVLESRLNFDLDGVTTNFTPSGVPMPAVGWRDTRDSYPYKGYVELSLGSWLDTRLNAGARFIDKPNTMCGIYLRHNSTWLWKPEYSDGAEEFRRRLADQEIGVYLRHLKRDAGILDFDAKYRVAYFNYYAMHPEDPDLVSKAPTQTLNSANFHLMWKSEGESKFRYYAGADVRYNGFRSFYTEMVQERYKGNRETIIAPRGGIGLDFGSSSSIGLDLGADIVLYAGGKDSKAMMACPDNYTRLSLTPHYKSEGENLYLFAGPKIDMMFNNGPFFRIAPDFRLGWHIKGLAVELSATGGTELNTLDYNIGQNLYCATDIFNAEPVYVPFEGGLKFAFGPFAGFKAEISGKFRRALGQHVEGAWYQYYLNGTGMYMAGEVRNQKLYNDASVDMYGVSMGVKLAYNYGRYFGMEAEATYQPQDGKKGFFNGFDLPEATGRISARSNPWSSLKLGLDWNLRACRRPLRVSDYDGERSLENRLMKNWSNLDFRASYDILKNLTVELEVNNLLNRLHQEWLPGLQAPGIRAHAGVIIQF